MREFVTAAEEAAKTPEEQSAGMEFMVDGRKCVAHRPKDGQLAVLMATIGRHSSESDKIAGIINFFVAVLDKPSHPYIVDRLLDYEDPFGVEQVQDIMEWMIEEWSGRPTQSPSVSTASPPSTGQVSTLTTSQ